MALWGQRHKIEEINAEKPEGKLLQQIMQENDAAKKAALLDQFSSEFPKHEATPWVLEQLQGIYVKANDADKIDRRGGQTAGVGSGRSGGCAAVSEGGGDEERRGG